ncbi:unnamed protein product [Cylindrotheca closterium]|uniref:Uncharacterized protein n=1 Tax=Cylindrotheca closterium TaxID=2856 RepID=A0AAD2FJG0_9STRA|nr:unnamed protein product [Cylindrotheca closterium]
MKVALTFLLATLAAVVSAEHLGNPADEYKSENGLLEVTLTVGMVESLNGTRVAPGYNGKPMGPTLRVSPGDTLRVTLVNGLETTATDRQLYEYVMDEESDYVNKTIVYNRLSAIGNVYSPEYGFWGLGYSNLHFHGLENPPHKEELLTYVGQDETKVYEVKIPDDQEPGLFWYHNHVHGATVYAYLSSLMGAIIIEGTDSDITKAPGIENATEVVMLFSEYLQSPEGNFPMPIFPIVMSFGWETITNGYLAAETNYEFTEGETVLFRTISANVDPDHNFVVPGMTFYIVAVDGLPLPEPIPTDVVKIPSGGRVEFIGRFEQAGTYNMTREAWGSHIIPNAEACQAAFGIPAYPCISHDVDKPIGTITVAPASEPLDALPPLADSIELPEYSDRLKCLGERPIAANKNVTFEQKQGWPLFQIEYDGDFVPPGVAFGVDGALGTPNRVSGTIMADSCEEWHVEFVPPIGHPFHSHAGKFYLLAEGGVAVEDVVWRDTYSTFAPSIDVKICWDRVGVEDVVMVHCHAATHLDTGMLTNMNVSSNPDGDTCGVPSSTATGDDSVPSNPETSNSFRNDIVSVAAGILVATSFALMTSI